MPRYRQRSSRGTEGGGGRRLAVRKGSRVRAILRAKRNPELMIAYFFASSLRSAASFFMIMLVTAREWTQDYEWTSTRRWLKQGISLPIIDASLSLGDRPT
jgi:hypothetical protein